MAVREGHAAVVELLLESGADPGQSRYTYNSWDKLLAIAAERGHREVFSLLRQAMAARFGYDGGFEPLAAAVRDRDRERIEALLAADPDLVRAADALGNNLLHWAAITRQLDLVDRFHELGADIDARRADGRAPVQVAVDGDYWFRPRNLPEDAIPDPWVVARRLLDRGARRDLTLVCRMGDIDGVRTILAADPGAASRLDPARRSPLTAAVQAGHLELALLLLDYRADPAQPEDLAPRGAALHEAAAANRLDLAALLLDHEADPDAEVDSSGDCWFIVEWSHPEECGPMQELLRRRGATPTPPDSPEEMERALLEGYPASGNWLFMANLLNSKDADLHDLFLERWGHVVADLAPGDVWGGDVPSPELLVQAARRRPGPEPAELGRTDLPARGRREGRRRGRRGPARGRSRAGGGGAGARRHAPGRGGARGRGGDGRLSPGKGGGPGRPARIAVGHGEGPGAGGRLGPGARAARLRDGPSPGCPGRAGARTLIL